MPGGSPPLPGRPQNPRGGTFFGKPNEQGIRPSATWDPKYNHWDVDDGYGNRQRYNSHGAPISEGEAHSEIKGSRNPFGGWGSGIMVPESVLQDLLRDLSCRNGGSGCDGT